MYVVWVIDTGYSDESMRFATKREAVDFINAKTMPWNFDYRYED